MSKKKLLLYAILILGLGFYSFNPLGLAGWTVCQFLSLLLIFYGLGGKRRTNIMPEHFTLLIYWNFLGLAISVFSAYIFHQQNFFYSFIGYSGFLFIMLYFYLHRKKIAIKTIEDVVITLGIVFQVIYWMQDRSNLELFGRTWKEASSGIERMMFDGRHIFILSFYIILTRFKLRVKSIILFLLFLSSVFILETRQLLIPALLITLFHFRKMLFKNIIIGIVIVCAGIFVVNYNNQIIDTLFSKSIKEINSNRVGADRWQSVYYYMFEYNKNLYTRIFGEGYPAPGSAYNTKYVNAQQQSGLSPGDIGPLGWSAFLGIIWGVTVILMVIKGMIIKVTKHCMYAKYYMFNVAFTLFFGEGQFVRTSAIITIAVVFYIIDKASYELKQDILLEYEVAINAFDNKMIPLTVA